MKKIVLSLLIGFGLLFGAVDFNKASKEELTSIKGIGSKKALAIMEYRKKNSIKSVDDLILVKGFGKKSVEKIKKNLNKTTKK